MTPTAPEGPPAAPVRAWRAFRRWRRGRPFWGGLWTVLSGVFIFLSTQLDLGSVQLRMGEEGFQSLVIPAVLVIAGLLLWFTPAQRVFYGVIAVIVALASLILVNLGGFFIGALLGMIGGGLGFAWTPRPRVGADAVPDEETTPDEPPTVVTATRAGGLDMFFPDERADGPDGATGPDEDPGDEPDVDGDPGYEPPTVVTTRPSHGGPLGDRLPTGTVSPLAEGAAEDRPREFPGRFAASLAAGDPGSAGDAGSAGDPDAYPGDPDASPGDRPSTGDRPFPSHPDASAPAGPDPRPPSDRGGPPAGLVVLLVALSVALTGLAVARHPLAASAAPCPPGSGTTATSPTAAASPTADGTGLPRVSASASTPDAGGVVAGAPGILVPQLSSPAGATAGADAAATTDPNATATPVPDASATPAPPAATSSPSPPVPPAGSIPPRPAATPTAGTPTRAPGACPDGSVAAPAARMLAAAADQPLVNEQPSLMTAASLTMTGLAYDGVVDLPTRAGTVRALRFSMDRTVSTPFDLRVSQHGVISHLRSDRLTVSGAVLFYTSRFEAKLGGVVPVTYTPDSPPPLILPDLVFTDASIDLVYVTGGTLTASNLDISLA